MSGEKRTYVSVEERELQRLREQESRLRTVNRDLPERLNAIRQQAQREMQNRLAPMEARQQRQEKMVKGLQSDLCRLEKDTQQRLARQHREFTDSLRQQRGEYLRLFEQQDRKFTGMVENERRERQAAVRDLQNQINVIVADADRKQAAAAAFVSDLSKIMQETANLPHDRFAPGHMENIRRHAEDANRSLNAGMPEACLSTAQKAYWDLADLRVLVLQKEREFMFLHQAAMEEARAILEEARANRQYQLEVGEGTERDVFSLEVDHWTDGDLSAYEKQIADLENYLREGENNLSTEQVRDILEQLESLKPRMPEIVEHARQNILASQLRSNIAELAVESFQREGFSVDDAAYEGDDERNAYVVKMKNRAGSEVVTVISPVQGEFGKNTVSVHSYDELFTDEITLQQRAKELVGMLNEEGLQAGPPECRGSAKPEFRDMAAVRTRKTGASA